MTAVRYRVTACTPPFPDEPINQFGNPSTAVSKFVNRRLDAVLGADRRLVFQSLRTTGTAAMRQAGVDKVVRIRMLGHGFASDHDLHCEQAQHLTAHDLLPAATAVAAMLRRARLAGPPASANLRDRDRKTQSPNGFEKHSEGHSAIRAPHPAPGMAGERIVNILSDADFPAERLEGMANRVKNDARVLDSAPVIGPQQSHEDLAKVRPAPSVVVELKLREQPFFGAEAINVAAKACRYQPSPGASMTSPRRS